MPARRSGKAVAATYAVAVTAFAGTAGLLAARVQAGDDPAIGQGPAAASTPRPRVIVTRRIHRTTIITTRVRRPRAVAATTTGGSDISTAGGGGTVTPTRVSPTAPAAAPSAPPPAAPAPTPVTRAS